MAEAFGRNARLSVVEEHRGLRLVALAALVAVVALVAAYI
jgi:hypothetical protein